MSLVTRSSFTSRAPHQRIGSRSDPTVGVRNVRLHLSRSVVPNSPDLNSVNYKLQRSCNSRSIRRRSRMWMNSRSNRLKMKSGLVWSRIIDTAINKWRKRLHALYWREGPTFRTLSVAVEQRDIWINCQPE